jgi:hypothetical protein
MHAETTFETVRQRRDRLERKVPGYLSDRDIERLIAGLLDGSFIDKLADAIARKSNAATD